MSEVQLELFEGRATAPSFPRLDQVLRELPPIPNVVRYFSDFYQTSFSISRLNEQDIWPFEVPEADARSISFAAYSDRIKGLMKSWAIWALSRIAPVTILSYHYNLRKLGIDLDLIVEELLESPIDAKSHWEASLLGRSYSHEGYCALKSVLQFFCEWSIGGWTPEYRHYLASFPLPQKAEKYVSVREGSSYLSASEQSAVIAHFDGLTEKIISSPNSVSDILLRETCLLYWAFSHGVRPIQLANRELTDVRLWQTELEGVALHLRFRYAKQRSRGREAVQTRAMKREWSPLMGEYLRRRRNSPAAFLEDPQHPDSLFGLRPKGVSRALKRILLNITGVERRPYALRHTAAQRNVDAGMSALELAEFLMHADIDTGQVYYQTSSTQAEKINTALGLSPVYSTLASAIATRKLSKAELLALPIDQQIGAAPHGYPIAGIGACTLGQQVCTKNPALSCYSCPKFLALADRDIHIQVRGTLQTIVKQFSDSEGGGLGQPTYTQLRAALEGVASVIKDLSSEGSDQ